MGTDRQNVVPGNLYIIWKLNEAWLLKRTRSPSYGSPLPAYSVSSTTSLRLLKFWILKNRLRHFPNTLKAFNTEKGHYHCLKVFNMRKELHHYFRTLKVFTIEERLHHFLETLKVFQNSYSVECWWTATSEGRLVRYIMFMIKKLHLLWVPNFIALGIYFLCGTKRFWNEKTDTCFNVWFVLLGRNFDFLGGYCLLPNVYYWLLLVTWWLLLVTGGYCSLPLVTARSHF